MAITCPKCGAGFDVTLFQYGHGVRCDCGQWVELDRGHVIEENLPNKGPGDVPGSIRLAPDTEPDDEG